MNYQNDEEFDRLLTEQLSEPPAEMQPEDSRSLRANPWSEPLLNIVTGLAMTSIMLQFLLLDYILPVFGAILLYNGLRSLRGVNGWFRAGWMLSIAGLARQAARLAVYATPLADSLTLEETAGLRWAVLFATVSFFWVLRQGFRSVYRANGVKPPHDPLLLLSLWWTTLFAASHHRVSPQFALVLLIGFLFILRALNHILDKLGDKAYCGQCQPVHADGVVLKRIYLTVCALIVVSGSLFSNLSWTHGEDFSPAAAVPEREALVQQGFPEALLADLPEDEASLLYGVKRVLASSQTDTLRSPAPLLRQKPSSLQSRTVWVRTEDEKVYVVQSFEWKDKSLLWSDGFSVLSGAPYKVLGGALLYEEDGVQKRMEIPRLRREESSYVNFWGHLVEDEYLLGGVNFPPFSDRQRGYVLLELHSEEMASVRFAYLHHALPLQFPYRNPERAAASPDYISGLYVSGSEFFPQGSAEP